MIAINDEVLQWATPREIEFIEAYKRLGNILKVATEFGVNDSSVSRAIAAAKKRAASKGFSPDHDMIHPVPDGFQVKGVSTYYGDDGKPKGQWVKSARDKEDIQALTALMVEGLLEPVKGKTAPVAPPLATADDLLVKYPIADWHLGLYAWKDETGEDCDLNICKELLSEGIADLVARSPAAHTAYIVNVGDFYHTDTEENKTRKSGHVLDVDSRYAKVLLIGIKMYRDIITLALSKHQKVVVRFAKGNHDEQSILTLAIAMTAYFENEPRVDIVLPINAFQYYDFGVNLFGAHHGNLKPANYPGIMACDQAALWGQTKMRVWDIGHKHQDEILEFPGCRVERHNKPTPADSWTHVNGYRAMQSLKAIAYHRTRGEVSRAIRHIFPS